MARSTLIALSALAIIIGGCASYIDKPYQRIHLSTPGAKNAECILEAGGSKAIARPPQKITIRNNDEPLNVTCRAPGNRVRHVSYQPSRVESAKYNIATGYAPGMYYDHVERSLYTYPDNIVVDFKNVEARPNTLPDYQYATTPAPTEAPIENFGPGRSLLSWEEKQPSSDAQSASDNKGKNESSAVSVPTPLPGKKDMTGAQSSQTSDRDMSKAATSQSAAQDNMTQEQTGSQNKDTGAGQESTTKRTAAEPVNIQPRPSEESQAQSSSSGANRGDRGNSSSSFEARARQQAQEANQAEPQSGGDGAGNAMSSPTQLY